MRCPFGTETSGSVVCPSSANSVVCPSSAIGRIDRSGIVPISHSQDTAGPMARSVRDAVILPSAMGGEDPRDPATAEAAARDESDYTPFLEPDGLRGALAYGQATKLLRPPRHLPASGLGEA